MFFTKICFKNEKFSPSTNNFTVDEHLISFKIKVFLWFSNISVAKIVRNIMAIW